MVMNIRDYYRTPDIRSRMVEILGGPRLEEATCCYIGRCYDSIRPGFNMRRPGELDLFLDNEWDVARSLWDKQWLVADLDVEYVNFDFPAEPFLDYRRTFSLQEPLFDAASRILTSAGLRPLCAVSGRGYHFMWQVRPGSTAFESLVEMGRVPPALARMYATPQPPEGRSVDLQMGRAFAGLGLLMERLAHRIRAESQARCPIPISLEALAMGPQERGREIVVLDISEYGDPLHTRAVRMPFSIYLKPWQHPDTLTPEIESRVPVMVMVPMDGGDTEQVTAIMRDIGKAAAWAAQVSCLLPDGSFGTEALIAEYQDSDLRGFHDWFYSVEHDPPERWPSTYDRLSFEGLPAVVRYALENPNEALLKPDFLRPLVAALLEQGWHPRHIAGLIRSKYERDFGWLNQWFVYDAGTRADFHVRVLGGMMELGRDHSMADGRLRIAD
jgi:hypothetical protein